MGTLFLSGLFVRQQIHKYETQSMAHLNSQFAV